MQELLEHMLESGTDPEFVSEFFNRQTESTLPRAEWPCQRQPP
jgi:hypothetical protein